MTTNGKDSTMTTHSQTRIHRALVAMSPHDDGTDCGALSSVLADLLAFCDRYGVPFDVAMMHARKIHDDERAADTKAALNALV